PWGTKLGQAELVLDWRRTQESMQMPETDISERRHYNRAALSGSLIDAYRDNPGEGDPEQHGNRRIRRRRFHLLASEPQFRGCGRIFLRPCSVTVHRQL